MTKVINILLSLVCLCSRNVLSQQIDINLRNFAPNSNDRNAFIHEYNIANDVTKISITEINEEVGFLVVQAHSYLENVTLSDSSNVTLQSSVRGTNIGLVWAEEANNKTFYLLRESKINLSVPIMLVVNLYDEEDPVPGGCNLSFDTVVAPYQIVSDYEEYISVKSQPPSAYSVSCDMNKADIEMYHMFFDEHDNTNVTYFEGIRKMLTVDGIRKFGRSVSKDDGYFKYDRIFSNYRGTGRVFAIVATFGNRSAAYVPAVSYGCDVLEWEHSCVGPVTDQWKVLVSIQFIFGMFICFCGHRFFRFTLMVIGFTFGVLLTYCVISLEDHSSLETAITSVAIGFMYGLFWAFVWWKFGIPMLSVHLAIVLSGFLLASVLFYTGLGDFDVFTNNGNYWMTFIAVILVYVLLWLPFSLHANVFACSFLGAYAYITAVSYYIGGNLQYIIINTYRRIATKHFSHAVIDPPFQFSDILYCSLWVFFLTIGVFIQLRDQKRKPPFPPNRYPVVIRNISERTPLIRPQTVAPPDYV